MVMQKLESRKAKVESDLSFAGFCTSYFLLSNFLRLLLRQFVSVLENEPRQLARAPKSWNKHARLREKTEEPAEIESVGPIRNRGLVASQKSERRADAMDRRAIPDILSQEQSQLLLRPAANCNDHVGGPARINRSSKSVVADLSSVERRDITISR